MTYPDAVAAWKKERFVKVCDGTSQNQWSKVAKPRPSAEKTGICSGVYPIMISGVLFVTLAGGAISAVKTTDVVGHEAVHCRLLTRIVRRVVWSHHLREWHEAVLRILDAEQISV